MMRPGRADRVTDEARGGVGGEDRRFGRSPFGWLALMSRSRRGGKVRRHSHDGFDLTTGYRGDRACRSSWRVGEQWELGRLVVAQVWDTPASRRGDLSPGQGVPAGSRATGYEGERSRPALIPESAARITVWWRSVPRGEPTAAIVSSACRVPRGGGDFFRHALRENPGGRARGVAQLRATGLPRRA